ncbi:MAG: glycine cleavage system aminomethyltransferase GcvT [Pseudomonadota bacterium]
MSPPLETTPLHEEHRRLGAKLVPFAGYEMPIQYTGIAAEHQAVRTRAGLFDVSHMGEIEVTGPDAVSLVDRLITNDLGRLADGRALYTVACNERGTILDDLIVYRRSATSVLVVCNASNRAKIAEHFLSRATETAHVRDASNEYALLALQGPRAFDVFESAGGDPAIRTSLPSFHFRDTNVGDIDVIASRTGYTGEDGLELFVAPGSAATLFRKLLTAGEPLGLVPAGLGARDTLRLEARLPLYGNELDETTNPFEAGLGWVVKLDKGDFLGRAALSAVKIAGVTRKLVGFEMTGRGIARHGYPLLDTRGAVVGVCTSGSPSPTLGTNIGLGYLPPALAAIGTEILVDCRGKHVPARVVATPFYRRRS